MTEFNQPNPLPKELPIGSRLVHGSGYWTFTTVAKLHRNGSDMLVYSGNYTDENGCFVDYLGTKSSNGVCCPDSIDWCHYYAICGQLQPPMHALDNPLTLLWLNQARRALSATQLSNLDKRIEAMAGTCRQPTFEESIALVNGLNETQ